MKRAMLIFSLLVAAGVSPAQVSSPATGGGTQRGTGATGGATRGTGGTAAGGLPADRTPVVIPPTTPVLPPSGPVLPPPAPVTPPGARPLPGQVTPPSTQPVVPPPVVPGLTPPVINPNTAVLPPPVIAPPPAVTTPPAANLPGLERRTNAPPALVFTNRTNITPVQRAQINRLVAELNMFRPGAQLGAEQRNRLANALSAAGNPATPVPQSTLIRLSDNLIVGLSGLNLTPQQRHQLAIDLNMLLHSGRLSPAETQIVINDVRNLLQRVGVNAEAVNTLTADLTGLSQSLQQGAAATTSSVGQTQP